MHDQMGWSRYIDATSGGVMNTEIATRADVDPATVGRWRTGARDPKPRQVVAYARAFGLSPISALIAAGYLSPEELDLEVKSAPSTLRDFSLKELVDEVSRRIELSPVGDTLPLPHIEPTGDDDGNHISVQ